MKAAILYKYNEDLVYDDVPKPELIEADDVIVKIVGAGVCRTDLHEKEGKQEERTHLPLILGHENVGFVDEISDQSYEFLKGQPVIMYPYITRGYCLNCRRGNDIFCTENPYVPGIDVNGGYAEFLKTKVRSLVSLPNSISKDEMIRMAPIADAGITVYHAIKKIRHLLIPDSTVVVIGAGGGLGHMAVQIIKNMSTATIIAVDKNEHATRLAEDLGADYGIVAGTDNAIKEVLEITHGTGAEIVFDFVGEGSATINAVKMIKNQGTLSVIGYGGTFCESTHDLITREINIIGNLVGNYSEFVEMVSLYLQHKFKVVGPTYSLKNANNALEDLKYNRYQGRATLMPS